MDQDHRLEEEDEGGRYNCAQECRLVEEDRKGQGQRGQAHEAQVVQTEASKFKK